MSTPLFDDLIVASRGGTDYQTTADMSSIQDTDLILVNRGGTNYKCTAADWKTALGGSGGGNPVINSVSLQDVIGGGRFTSTDFPLTLRMRTDSPVKRIKAWVKGNLNIAASLGAISSVSTGGTGTVPVTPTFVQHPGTGGGALEADPNTYTRWDVVGQTAPIIDFGVFLELKTIKVRFRSDFMQASFTCSAVTETGTVIAGTSPSQIGQGPPYNTANNDIADSSVATFPAGTYARRIQLNFQVNGVGLKYTDVFVIWINDATIWPTQNVATTFPSTLTFADASKLSAVSVGEVITKDGGGATAKVLSKGTSTLQALPLTGALAANDVVLAPEKLVTGGTLYCVLDSAGNVSGLQGTDPGYTVWAPSGTGPYTGAIKFPALIGGVAPDAKLPDGTTLQAEVEASKGIAKDVLASELIVPGSAGGSFDVALLAGGGGGGLGSYSNVGCGGGGGGLLIKKGHKLSPGSYTISIGGGGAGGAKGTDTTAFGLTAVGGGHGGIVIHYSTAGDGGSGGGGSTGPGKGTPGQGQDGGTSMGGGFNTSEGIGYDLALIRGGAFFGVAGGGAYGAYKAYMPATFGGGRGGYWSDDNDFRPAGSGAATTGGGGGGSASGGAGGGGSGQVVIRYPGPQRATGGTVTNPTIEGVEYTVHVFTASGTFVFNG